MIKSLICLMGFLFLCSPFLPAGSLPDSVMSHADSVALLEAYSVFLDYPVSLDTIEIDLDSTKAVQMYQKYQLLTMMSADPDIIKTAWSRVERKRYQRYDMAMSPPSDSLYYRLYRGQQGKMTACTFRGDHYVVEMKYPFDDTVFIERRFIIPEVDVGLISARLANPLFVMTTKRETVTYPFGHGAIISFDTLKHAETLISKLDSEVMLIERTFGVTADSMMQVYLVTNTRELVNSPMATVSRAIQENNMLLADLVTTDFGDESKCEAMAVRIGRELVHVIIGGSEAYGMGYVYQPMIREGLSAMLYGDGIRSCADQMESIQSQLKNSKRLPLDTMMAHYDSLDAQNQSAFAGCLMRFLFDRYGVDRFASFCRSYQANDDMTAMLKTVLRPGA